MAIARTNSAAIANWSTSNPATASFDCSGGDFLVIGVFTNGATSALSATYNGVSMTQLSFFSDGSNKNAMFYLANPASGSNTISVTRTGGSNMSIVAAAYSGVDQTTPIDASVTKTRSSSPFVSPNITVSDSNNWLVATFRREQNVTITSSDMTKVVASTIVFEEIWDSNSTVSAGTQNVTYTFSTGDLSGYTMISLQAAGAAGPTFTPKVTMF